MAIYDMLFLCFLLLFQLIYTLYLEWNSSHLIIHSQNHAEQTQTIEGLPVMVSCLGDIMDTFLVLQLTLFS